MADAIDLNAGHQDGLIDILHADIVLVGVSLLQNEDEREKFTRNIDGAEVITMEVGQTLPGDVQIPHQTTIKIERDRITITLSQGRTIIRRDYPSRLRLEEDLEHLSGVIVSAIRHSEWASQPLTGFGYNMSCVFNPGLEEPAVSYIRRMLFRTMLDGELLGGTARLYALDRQDRRLTFDIQPRPAEDLRTRHLYVGLNMHSVSNRMPKPESILPSLLELKNRIVRFMSNLSESHG